MYGLKEPLKAAAFKNLRRYIEKGGPALGSLLTGLGTAVVLLDMDPKIFIVPAAFLGPVNIFLKNLLDESTKVYQGKKEDGKSL